ncbi:MAG: hypothetical protein K0R92_2966 [Lachnospiraceae bacterium]|nr:hypothetical protein [Lachnospiraceae bacterium]
MGAAVSLGVLFGFIQVLFYILGILCFIKYLKEK